jgi:transmembrane sensor
MSLSKPTDEEIARLMQASDWIARLSASADPTLVEECMHWCEKDPLNGIALQRVQVIWDAFPTALPQRIDRAGSSRGAAARFGLAASLAAILAVTAWLLAGSFATRALDTAPGEQRHATLPDGSQLDLAPDSLLTLRFSPLVREVRLERGEAYFAVAPSKLRPFVVQANGVTATALGTAFDVRIRAGGTMVAVSEGQVTMAGTGAKSIDPPVVRAQVGQQVTYSPAEHMLSVIAMGPKVAGSWRRGLLQFVGEPLPEVVAEVNRYVKRQIVLGPDGRNVRFTGTVAPQKVGEFLEALRQIYPIGVLEEDAHAVHVESQASPGAR